MAMILPSSSRHSLSTPPSSSVTTQKAVLIVLRGSVLEVKTKCRAREGIGKNYHLPRVWIWHIPSFITAYHTERISGCPLTKPSAARICRAGTGPPQPRARTGPLPNSWENDYVTKCALGSESLANEDSGDEEDDAYLSTTTSSDESNGSTGDFLFEYAACSGYWGQCA
ncbi:hypothetical protein F5Y03DRAFT_397930 [Xylaria venustula]|nr:hypothetical protein F5Y03DRAFT_397930 [Xylaria venustula]